MPQILAQNGIGGISSNDIPNVVDFYIIIGFNFLTLTVRVQEKYLNIYANMNINKFSMFLSPAMVSRIFRSTFSSSRTDSSTVSSLGSFNFARASNSYRSSRASVGSLEKSPAGTKHSINRDKALTKAVLTHASSLQSERQDRTDMIPDVFTVFHTLQQI